MADRAYARTAFSAARLSMKAASSRETSRRRILVVDDHPLFCEGVKHWIDRQPDLQCCGAASTGESARGAIAAHAPDAVVLDLRLRGEDGFELLGKLQTQFPEVPLLVTSDNDELMFGERVLRAGAKGYLMKNATSNELLLAIRTVLSGNLYVSRKLAADLLKSLRQGATGISSIARLSAREQEVFRLLGSGLGTAQIARKLKVSVKTVETHRDHIKRKLGLKNAASLVHAATTWSQSQTGLRP